MPRFEPSSDDWDGINAVINDTPARPFVRYPSEACKPFLEKLKAIARVVVHRSATTQYQEYLQLVQHAADQVEQKNYQGALETLQNLVASDISDKDKAMMCLNIAIVYDKLGCTDDALAWYGKGVEYERRAGAVYVTERRAAYLAEKGQFQESMLRYQELLGHPSLAEDDKVRIRTNSDLLLRRVM